MSRLIVNPKPQIGITVARQRRTSLLLPGYQYRANVTGFAVTSRAIRGYGNLNCRKYSIMSRSINGLKQFVKSGPL
jgi:hypothetical protein